MYIRTFVFARIIGLNATINTSRAAVKHTAVFLDTCLLCAGKTRTPLAYQSRSIWLNKCDKLCMEKCKRRMHKRPLKNAASLSLNKDVHSGSRNPILHSSKSPSKPCDHFVVYLYQSVEKLNRADTSHMLIPFMFPGLKTLFFLKKYI